MQLRILVLSLVFSIASLGFHSCSSDDGDITGVYNLTSYSISNCSDEDFNLTIENGCSSFQGSEVCLEGTITINADNSFSISFTISFDGSTESQSGSGTYSLSGNTITICDGNECFDGSISGNNLTLSLPEDDGCILTLRAQK